MTAPTSLSKYDFSSPREAALHPGRVIGRRPSDGMPVLGAPGRAPDMIGDQADELATAASFHCRMFRMWDEADLDAYRDVMDHVMNGQFSVAARREILAEEGETGLPGQQMKVWLEWGQVYVLAPDQGGGRR